MAVCWLMSTYCSCVGIGGSGGVLYENSFVVKSYSGPTYAAFFGGVAIAGACSSAWISPQVVIAVFSSILAYVSRPKHG